MGKKNKLATPKDVSGGGGKSGKTYHRSAVDEDMKIFISLAIEHKEEGKKLFQKRDHEGAMSRYGKAINLLPKDHTDVAYLRTSIASCYMQMGLGWYPNAISECDLALEASPRYSKALLRRSQCYEALNKLDYAFRDARTVLNMEPKNASANEIFERVKTRLVKEGVDVDEMHNFVSVQPVGAARLRKIVNESGGKGVEPTYHGMNDAETTAEATLNRNVKIQMKAAAITTESGATDVVHDAEETNYMDDLDQEDKDHLLAQEEMDKTKLGLDSSENPKPQPQRILGESSTKTHTYRLYSKGLVSEELIKNVTTPVGGSGLSLCDSNDNSKWETNKALRNQVLLAHPEAAELAAIVQGLNWALELGVNCIQFFCDDSIILDYVTRKAAPPNESIVAKLLDRVALLQTRFTSCQALPLQTDISYVIKLARDAIASQTTWRREDGIVVEACGICYEDVPADEKFTVSGCFHRICCGCMRQYITHSLRQRSRLICPNVGCKSELKPADCNRIADPDQLALMVERKAEESIEVSDRVYCPNPRCSILMSAQGLPAVDPALPGARKCLGCGLRFCVDCKMEWHTKLSCAAFRNTKAYTKSGTAVFDAVARELGLKKCRKCLSTVERTEGCKHMTCTFCKYEFCYTCGYEWKNKKPTCRCATKV